MELLEEMGDNKFIREVDRWTDGQHHEAIEESLDPSAGDKEYGTETGMSLNRGNQGPSGTVGTLLIT